MKRMSVLIAVCVALFLLIAPAALAAPVPKAYGDFTGVDEAGTTRHVKFHTVASPDNKYYPIPDDAKRFLLGAGEISFTSRESLPDGTEVKKAFTMRVDYYFSVDFFLGMPDAGAAAGICGPVVASKGDGVPAVGDYYMFQLFDGAHGLANPDGTVIYYPDRWKLTHWSDSPIYMRNYQRTVLSIFYLHGENLWPVTEGDLSVKGGLVFQ